MNLDELKDLVNEGINKGELIHICRIRTYSFLDKLLDKQIFFATKKGEMILNV